MTINVKDNATELSAPVMTLLAGAEHVPVRAAHGEGTAYLTNQSGVASFNGGWIDCLNFPFVSISIWWTAVPSTAGTLSLQATDDPAQTSALDTITDFNTTVDATAGYAAWRVRNPPRYLRVIWTWTAGGAASQFNGVHTRRSA